MKFFDDHNETMKKLFYDNDNIFSQSIFHLSEVLSENLTYNLLNLKSFGFRNRIRFLRIRVSSRVYYRLIYSTIYG